MPLSESAYISLGKSRFLKTIKCRHAKEGAVVVKIFMKQTSLDFSVTQHVAQMVDLKSALIDVANCCSFSSIVESDRAVCLIRQFHQYSLYDRIRREHMLLTIADMALLAPVHF